ncbi:MAG: restriction endonuclease subunit S [Clostridiales bacterium]|nr:restriction endonuclease subunit S [Clostridiales bacterium]
MDNCQLPKGYKNTEVGVIPEDWEVKRLSEIGKFSKGSGIKKDEALSGNIPCVRYGELYTRHNDYIKQFYSYISKDVSESAKKLKSGDILFAGSGETKEDIGKSVAFIDDFEAFAGGDIVILSPENTNSLYLGYLLNAAFIQKQKASRGQGDAVVHINSTQLGNISIPLPKEEAEQTAIATALSDTDALIDSLEKLIAKKRDIKQGAMQQLLKPKEDWEVKKLGEVCEIFKGKGISKSQVLESGKYECVLYGELFTTYREVISNIVSKTNTFESIPSQKGDILYPGSTTTTGIDLAKASTILKNNVLLGGDIVILRKSNYDYNPIFLTYFLNTIRRNNIAQITKGITIHHLYGKDLADIDAEFPSIEKQNAIATILSDMDAEIEALEAKLDKYRKIKIGMMQNLLTGKIRLI